tara:strand:+ start:14514 stop:15908 length:1395 start_codon:yes stop_codon:yes gene_type:complete
MATTIELSYFNSFWLKRLKNYVQNTETSGASAGGTTNGTPNPVTGDGYINSLVEEDWYVEESRIRGGFNNVSTDYGVKAYLVEDDPQQQDFTNRLIYSGIFNSKTGINNTNQFPVGDEITRTVDPRSGSIQKLYAENTNLLIFQEKKVNNALIDKDAIYTADGSQLTTTGTLVIGQITPFQGNFGISRDPGSFAIFGYNKYWTDKDNSAVLKLGASGIEQISNFGMIDYFRDTLSQDGEITGGWDIYNKNYVLTLGNPSVTLAYDEIINGWTSFFDYIPWLTTSCLGRFISFKKNGIYEHYINSLYNNFYGDQFGSSVTFVFNPEPTRMKTFKTISYEGSNGWEVPTSSFTTDVTGIDSNPQEPVLGDTSYTDSVQRIYSYDEGFYTDVASQIEYRAGFDRKQNTYYAALKNNGTTRAMEVIADARQESGIKAFYATVKLQTDATTDPTGPKELFAVGTNYNRR